VLHSRGAADLGLEVLRSGARAEAQANAVKVEITSSVLRMPDDGTFSRSEPRHAT
jgi:hypothetical protein